MNIVRERNEFEKLGDAHKLLEEQTALMDVVPGTATLVVRLDGRAFHTFTKGLGRPYDLCLVEAMAETTKFLTRKTSANFGYTQSDEISLLFIPRGEHWFGGRVQKLTSVMAAMASVEFNKQIARLLPEKAHLAPVFDARAIMYSDPALIPGYFLWRHQDCFRNSISMAAKTWFSHDVLQGKSRREQRAMLREVGNPWEEMPVEYRWGVFAKRFIQWAEMTPEQISVIPEKHRRQMEGGRWETSRSVVRTCNAHVMVNRLNCLAEDYVDLRQAGDQEKLVIQNRIDELERHLYYPSQDESEKEI